MNREKILVVDDDVQIALAIKKLLDIEGYDVITAYDGMEALTQLGQNSDVKLIILDVMMPKLDGMSATMKIRQSINVPIIMLSAKSEDSDKILGLGVGADDYVTKPFNPAELIARVRSQIRRYTQLGNIMVSGSENRKLIVGGLILDTDAKQLFVDGAEAKLTATEFKIMQLLMSNAGMVFSAEKIYERVWNEEAFSVENTVMVHIRRIREKIEVIPKEPKYLKVVWGIGYKIEKY